MSLSDF